MTLASIGNLFGLDTLIIILVVALLFGGKKLPELAKSLGASIREFKKGKDAPDHLDDKPS
jgi:sec-independent protein translocase protein TatA